MEAEEGEGDGGEGRRWRRRKEKKEEEGEIGRGKKVEICTRLLPPPPLTLTHHGIGKLWFSDSGIGELKLRILGK